MGDRKDTGLHRLRTREEYEACAPTISIAEFRRSSLDYTISLKAQLESEFRKASEAARSGDTTALDKLRAAWEASVKEVHLKGFAEGPLNWSEVKDSLPVKRFAPLITALGRVCTVLTGRLSQLRQCLPIFKLLRVMNCLTIIVI